MKKRINIIFFSICFFAALLAEAYCIQVLEGDLFSVVGIGIVVLITGYLLMDAVRTQLIRSSENAKTYMEHMYKEEAEKWNERFTEFVNLQKATYTATKKNTAMMAEQFEEILLRMETVEANNAKAIQKITELQKKSLEGQKNALNLEINYSKENTKQLINVLREEGNHIELKEQLKLITSYLEDNNELLKAHMNNREDKGYGFDSGFNIKKESGFAQDNFMDKSFTEDFYEELDTQDHVEEDVGNEENASETSMFFEEELELEAINSVMEAEETVPTVTPLYDDPNKALTADEIANLFASFGK
ncbi:MAG: hypothetical protein ACYDEX_03130 [Mobilitalea sp.]